MPSHAEGAAGDHCRNAALGVKVIAFGAGLWSEYRARVLPMKPPIIVQIIGAPVACADSVRDTWRGIANLTRAQLQHHFGEAVQVDYFDLFDPNCPALPPEAQLPLVLIGGQVFSSGGKISAPAIRRRLEGISP